MAVYRCAGRKRGVCSHESDQPWMGRCPGCLRFYNIEKIGAESTSQKSKFSVTNFLSEDWKRISTGIKELDDMLNGGIVVGSTSLLYGEKGTGKTTLLLQIAKHVVEKYGPVVYGSGEQNSADIGGYAARLKISSDQLYVLGVDKVEGNIETIVEFSVENKARLMIVDSLQKTFVPDTDPAVGSVASGKEVMEEIIFNCKKHQIPSLVVSHVDKQGLIVGGTGPEHDCDVMIEFNKVPRDDDEDDEEEDLRLLHIPEKNRFGPVKKRALFEMVDLGLRPVRKKSRLYSV